MSKKDKAIVNVIKAWESLPEGEYDPRTIDHWLNKKMFPAINKLRKLALKKTT